MSWRSELEDEMDRAGVDREALVKKQLVDLAKPVVYEPYGRYEVEVGRLTKEVVGGVAVPRDDYLKMVDEAIEMARENAEHFVHVYERGRWDPSLLDREADHLRETARTMTHFVFGDWVNHRGCGCLVGESVICGDRRLALDLADGVTSIRSLIERSSPPKYVHHFVMSVGHRIDEILRDRCVSELMGPRSDDDAHDVVFMADQPVAFFIDEAGAWDGAR